MMKRLFKGGTVVSGEGLKKIDLFVKGEKILAAGKNLAFQDAEVIDVRGKLLFPGFIDAHTHMRREECRYIRILPSRCMRQTHPVEAGLLSKSKCEFS